MNVTMWACDWWTVARADGAKSWVSVNQHATSASKVNQRGWACGLASDATAANWASYIVAEYGRMPSRFS